MEHAFDRRLCAGGPRYREDHGEGLISWFARGVIIELALTNLMTIYAEEMDFDCLRFDYDAFNVLLDEFAVTRGILPLCIATIAEVITQRLDHHDLNIVRRNARYGAGFFGSLLE